MEREADARVMQKNLFEILFAYVMKGQWDEVVETYKTEADSRSAKITASLDTALHIAVSCEKHEIAYQLVKILGQNASEILKQKNKSAFVCSRFVL